MQPRLPSVPRSLALSSVLVLSSGLFALGVSGDETGAPPRGPLLDELNAAFAAVAAGAAPSVVHIEVRREVETGEAPELPGMPGDLFRHFRERMPPVRYGQGSGFVLGSDGLIVSNHHVVGDADRVTVRLPDGRELPAEVVGTDEPSDVALLRVDAEDLPALPVGDSGGLDPGEWVLAIGTPFGLDSSVSAGIVSATGRSELAILDYEDFIQTDAAINPGNSGGPLIDVHGNVVGMNTAILSRTGANAGVGLAIPIDLVVEIKDQLLESGTVTRGYLGVYLQELEPEIARALGLDVARGVLASRVIEGSPAAEAGIRRDDVIVEFEGRAVGDVQPFRNRVALIEPGTTVSLVVVREGERKELQVEIGELERGGDAAPDAGPALGDDLGLTVETLTQPLADQLGIDEATGVLVTDVRFGSPAFEAGLRARMVIVEVDRRPVTDSHDLERALAASADDGEVLLYVRTPGGGSRYLVLRPGV